MKRWSETIEIDAPIEQVWKYFDQSVEQMKKVMPNIVEHRMIHSSGEAVGNVYRQSYGVGERTEEYEVTIVEHEDEESKKRLTYSYTLAGVYDIQATYLLEKMGEEKTKFTYLSSNRPRRWYLRVLILFSNDQAVTNFVRRVKRVAEEEYGQSAE
ncbi:SRPBCC family protein [Salimicrobium halophilum]|uniref:Polyketide cyclase / dehydrase and lipid transport n=1 Tax=Salimicrobium halophilum TaxID=86666 RepID=A0A1G8UAM4_9BACI|nr:SRPBCC family protein [Salimicrobium halophilum]SDJ50235.1 Polyketide cyclase / dehydrase and lipid transport [Salimicrobium halophilum]